MQKNHQCNNNKNDKSDNDKLEKEEMIVKYNKLKELGLGKNNAIDKTLFQQIRKACLNVIFRRMLCVQIRRTNKLCNTYLLWENVLSMSLGNTHSN